MDIDELPPQYKLPNDSGKNLVKILVAVGVIAASAILAFVVIKALRSAPDIKGAVRVDSVPPGAVVTVDGTKLTNVTPLNINNLPLGTDHDLKIELPRHKPYSTKVTIPTSGGVVPVTALLTPISGQLVVRSSPPGADLYINGQRRDRTPCNIVDVDVETVKEIELRLKDHQPKKMTLTWPASGKLEVDVKLVK
jgi:PEGA domain